jgi:ABC-type uncharacterized transport system involved in gliding motility auxiliary subunit
MKRYLAIPGALLLIAAFVRATVNVEWDSVNFGLLAAGVAIVAATVIWNWQEVVDWVRDPRGVFAVTTAISVAVFVALLVVLNIAVSYSPWSVDLTASARNEVSEDTRNILTRVQVPVSLRQFGRASADPRVEQLLRNFERETPRVRVEFADADRDREQALRYGVIKLGTVIVIAGEKFRKVEEPNEQALITAILQVTSEQDRTICFVAGHGERGLADKGPTGLALLAATLDASNYRTETISLLGADVPEVCDAVVLAGPQEDLSDPEIRRLHAYGDRQGDLAILVEPDPAPSFASWLRPRGIEPAPGTIIDVGAGRSVGGDARTAPAAAYLDHPITRGFNIVAIFDRARPLHVIEQPEYGGRFAPLAQTGPRSFATTSADSEPQFNQAWDQAGPLTLAAAASFRVGRPDEQMRVAVFGDSDFISNAFLRRSGNRDFFLRTLAWLLGEEEATIVAVAARENRRLELTEGTRAVMYLVNLGVLPLIPLVAGVIVFLRSRR